MKFEVRNRSRNNATFKWNNQRAAKRQTEAQRSRIFAKHQALVGIVYRNGLAARRAALAELKKLPEYWDEDKYPRRVINPSSSAVASIRPAYGAVYVAFKSNPGKEYYYPVGLGTKELSAKAAQKLVTSPSIGKAMHNWFGPQHALKTHRTKKGNIAYNGRIFSLPKKSAY